MCSAFTGPTATPCTSDDSVKLRNFAPLGS
jgi:hypothetical protein